MLLCKGPESSSLSDRATSRLVEEALRRTEGAKGGPIYSGLLRVGKRAARMGDVGHGESARGSARYAFSSQFFISIVFEDQTWSIRA